MSENINREKHYVQKIKIGEIIAEIRLDKNLTQRELAERVGTRQSYLARVEKGDVNFTIDTLFDITEALDVSVAYIFLKAFWKNNIVSVNGKEVEATVSKLYEDILATIVKAVR